MLRLTAVVTVELRTVVVVAVTVSAVRYTDTRQITCNYFLDEASS